LRALAQSMAREFGPQGIHVSHVIIDGQIDTPSIREMSPDREEHTLLSPDSIAETYWQLHTQDRSAWTLEADLGRELLILPPAGHAAGHRREGAPLHCIVQRLELEAPVHPAQDVQDELIREPGVLGK
jgi:NAD(P)-dependent dehydrogenase (short-subunit alcohol dehydrogenase family)